MGPYAEHELKTTLRDQHGIKWIPGFWVRGLKNEGCR